MPRSREEMATWLAEYAAAHRAGVKDHERDASLDVADHLDEAAAALREGSNLDQLARRCEEKSIRLEAWPAVVDGPRAGEWCVADPRTDCLQLSYGASIEEASGNALTQLREQPT